MKLEVPSSSEILGAVDPDLFAFCDFLHSYYDFFGENSFLKLDPVLDSAFRALLDAANSAVWSSFPPGTEYHGSVLLLLR